MLCFQYCDTEENLLVRVRSRPVLCYIAISNSVCRVISDENEKMQGAYLIITVGIEFFILVGYLFYAIFRTYPEGEDRISLMSWTAGLIGILTLGLLVSVTLVASRMPLSDIIVSMAILIVDILGLYLLVDDTRRAAKKSQDQEKKD
jgi:hypothetical protein